MAKVDENTYTKDVMRSVENNHMWINAFACIRPTDELKMQVGERVLQMLASDENTIPQQRIEASRIAAHARVNFKSE